MHLLVDKKLQLKTRVVTLLTPTEFQNVMKTRKFENFSIFRGHRLFPMAKF